MRPIHTSEMHWQRSVLAHDALQPNVYCIYHCLFVNKYPIANNGIHLRFLFKRAHTIHLLDCAIIIFHSSFVLCVSFDAFCAHNKRLTEITLAVVVLCSVDFTENDERAMAFTCNAHQPLYSDDRCETTQFLETHSESRSDGLCAKCARSLDQTKFHFHSNFDSREMWDEKKNRTKNWKETIYPNVWRQAVHWNFIVQSITISGSSIRYIFNSCAVCSYFSLSFGSVFPFVVDYCCLPIFSVQFKRFCFSSLFAKCVSERTLQIVVYVEHMLWNSRTSNNSHLAHCFVRDLWMRIMCILNWRHRATPTNEQEIRICFVFFLRNTICSSTNPTNLARSNTRAERQWHHSGAIQFYDLYFH